MNLENSRNQSLTTQDTENSISLYSNRGLSADCLVFQTARILKIFPKFPLGMLEELKNAFAENGFDDDRMRDAINHVRDTYEGWDKLPNIANFISFDKRVKVFNYKQSIEIGHQYLDMIDTGINKPLWAYKEDVLKYKLKLWAR